MGLVLVESVDEQEVKSRTFVNKQRYYAKYKKFGKCKDNDIKIIQKKEQKI